MKYYSDEDVHEYRSREQVSLWEAHSHFQRLDMLKRIENADTIESLKDLLVDLIKKVYP